MDKHSAIPMLCLVVALVASCSSPRSSVSTSFTLLDYHRVAEGVVFGILSDGATSPRGDLCLADFSYNRVTCLSRDGKLKWTIGREGGGPGEFRSLQQVAFQNDGKLLAFDAMSQSLTVFDTLGAFVTTRLVPDRFVRVDDIIVIPSGGIAISGLLLRLEPGQDSAVHFFDASLQYQGSSGPLPLVSDRHLLTNWGTGKLGPGSFNGEILYTRNGPYEVYRIETGPQRRSSLMTVGFETSAGADQAYEVHIGGGVRSITRSKGSYTRYQRTIAVSDSFALGTRVQYDEGEIANTFLDIFGPSSLEGRVLLPKALDGITLLGIAKDSTELWGMTASADGSQKIYVLRIGFRQ